MCDVKFTACKHLDFSDNYYAKKQLLSGGKVFWLREAPYEGAARLVQFCKKRGRINFATGCTSAETAVCSDYEEIEHFVNVDD